MGGLLDGYLSRADLAAQLSLRVDTLAHWAVQGTGPAFVRVGGRIYYKRETVEAWIASRETNAGGRA